MVLIPPVGLKLASTGYRFARYYTHSPAYREKGPPLLPLRLLAPVLVATTLGIFVSGVWLMLLGHRSDQVLLIHKVSFIVWGVVFGIHLLAYFTADGPVAARGLGRGPRARCARLGDPGDARGGIPRRRGCPCALAALGH